jgi:hypothetical protein
MLLIKNFWKCEASETFFQKGFWPPEAKAEVTASQRHQAFL